MGTRVLVAEDEALIALSLADLLEAEGYDVTLAADGVDALDAARRMGGEGLIRAVRAERPGHPVVMVTGSAPFGGVEALRRHAGGDGLLLLLLKPADCGELAAALRLAVAAGDAQQGDGTAVPAAAPRMALAD